jgi:asparagine synthase (glutamine-hydrolysing)
MPGIAGIAVADAFAEVSAMLDRIAHRGNIRRKIIAAEGTTMGVCWNDSLYPPFSESVDACFVCDMADTEHYATAAAHNGSFLFSRDDPGVTPLYFGSSGTGELRFASEIKALIPKVIEIREVMPGTGLVTEPFLPPGYPGEPVSEPSEIVASDLTQLLEDAVSLSIRRKDTGSLLSGGLDSAAITAFAVRHISGIKTFTAGVEGAPDLAYASLTARYLGTDHHETIVTVNDLVSILPDVIWHLESFDPLLIRSSLLNFVAAREASGLVSDILSGEGADELFAGYHYLNTLPLEKVREELLRLTGKLHNTALQRVDRCASAFGMTARLIFPRRALMEYAMAVPVKLKIFNGEGKWLLRKAVEELLPPEIVWRSKAKFWEGGGVNEKLSEIAEESITDSDFRNERVLPNGWILSGKEELYYYRIFRDHFGKEISLSWMGRTDGPTVQGDTSSG